MAKLKNSDKSDFKINIPKEAFAEKIEVNKYYNENSYAYTYTYRYYDNYGKIVEE